MARYFEDHILSICRISLWKLCSWIYFQLRCLNTIQRPPMQWEAFVLYWQLLAYKSVTQPKLAEDTFLMYLRSTPCLKGDSNGCQSLRRSANSSSDTWS